MGNLLTTPPSTDFSGRTLALNPEKAVKFQCREFTLGPLRPWGVVPPAAGQSPALLTALMDGRLLDITDSHATGIKTRDIAISPVTETPLEDKKIYFVKEKDKDGNIITIMAVPKDELQAKDWDKQIEETGTIKLDLPKEEIEAPTGLTPVYTVELTDKE
jgi:hypothetical protein